MVYSAESERARELADEFTIPVGLHLNFTEVFAGRRVPPDIASRQRRIVGRMSASKYAPYGYWPDLARDVSECVRNQVRESLRLCARPPTHLDGHHHIRTAANLLLCPALRRGVPMRSSFIFSQGEMGTVNRAVCGAINAFIRHRHPTTQAFFSIAEFVLTARQSSNHRETGIIESADLPGMTSRYTIAAVMTFHFVHDTRLPASGAVAAGRPGSGRS